MSAPMTMGEFHSVADPATELDFKDLLAILSQGRKTIFLTLAAVLMLGVLVILFADRVYKVDALVQVEPSDSSMTAALGSLGQMFEQEQPVSAEIEILQSRLVVGQVVDDLHLDISAEPRRFPFIGSAIARWYEAAEPTDVPATPAPARLGLSHFSWGGDRVEVVDFRVPASLYGEQFKLEALGDQRFALRDPRGAVILKGSAGQRESARMPQGEVSLFVRDIAARQGAQFRLLRLQRSVAIANLQKALSVSEQGKQSGVLQITLKGSDDAQRLTQVLNSLVQGYVRQNVERRSAEAQQQLEFLRDQLPGIKKQLEDAENQLNALRLQKGSADLTKETQLLLEQSVDLQGQTLELQQKRAEVGRLYTANHPVVRTLDEQLADLKSRSQQLENRVHRLPETQQELLRLQRDVEVNTELYTSMLNTSQGLDVARAGTVGNVRIVDQAVVPYEHWQPKPALVLVMSAFLGLVLGCGALFVQRALHSGVSDPTIVEQQLGLSSYAAIPYSQQQSTILRKLARQQTEATGLLALNAPHDPATEALRSLRTSLHFAMLQSRNNILAFTGPSPGLGKSFVSINLGAVLAGSGKRVAVIDADMRRGHLHEYLRGQRAPGLSDYILGQSYETVVRSTPVDGLSFVSGGQLSPNPSELLLNERFGELLDRLSKEMDYVIVDTPPILAVTDAAIIGARAGSTFLVLKAGEHSLRMIEDCARRLRQANVDVRGVVFNQVGLGGSYYGYGYGTYKYDYASKKA